MDFHSNSSPVGLVVEDAEVVKHNAGAKIKERREFRGLKQHQLANMIGISPAHISYIESGQKDASVTVLLKIARALNCNIVDFFEGKIASPLRLLDHGDPSTVRMAPIVSRFTFTGGVVGYESEESAEIPQNFEGEIACAVLVRVTDNSMNPRFFKGDLLLIDLSEKARDGDCAVVARRGSDDTLIRQVYIRRRAVEINGEKVTEEDYMLTGFLPGTEPELLKAEDVTMCSPVLNITPKR